MQIDNAIKIFASRIVSGVLAKAVLQLIAVSAIIGIFMAFSNVGLLSTVSAQNAEETQLSAILSDDQEIPPVQTPTQASGTATVTLNATQTELTYTLNLTGPFSDAPNQAHIHVGSAGTAGPVIFFLCATDPAIPAAAPPGTQACPDAAGGAVSGTLTETDFVAQANVGITTFAEAINALLSGNAYINVHTLTNAPGEVRGQLGPVKFEATLDSAQEVPPVQTPTQASGTATMSLNATQTALEYTLSLIGPFTNAPTQAHIHVGPAGATGPVIFFLCATDPTTPAAAPPGTQACPDAAGGAVSGTLTETDFVAQADVGITTFAEAVNALLSGNSYVNVHTPANAPGEIRGQIKAAAFTTVSFAAQIQPIFTENCALSGCHTGSSPSAGLNLEAGQAYGNLVGVASTQVPSLNRVAPGDPENSYLFLKHSGAPGIVGSRMPLNNPDFFDQNPDLLELERRWIAEGALDN